MKMVISAIIITSIKGNIDMYCIICRYSDGLRIYFNWLFAYFNRPFQIIRLISSAKRQRFQNNVLDFYGSTECKNLLDQVGLGSYILYTDEGFLFGNYVVILIDRTIMTVGNKIENINSNFKKNYTTTCVIFNFTNKF